MLHHITYGSSDVMMPSKLTEDVRHAPNRHRMAQVDVNNDFERSCFKCDGSNLQLAYRSCTNFAYRTHADTTCDMFRLRPKFISHGTVLELDSQTGGRYVAHMHCNIRCFFPRLLTQLFMMRHQTRWFYLCPIRSLSCSPTPFR